jgi:hypothetical protein
MSAIWMPGVAGPLDELVVRIRSLVESFAREHGLEQAEVRVELADGRELLVSSIASDPGYGFLTLALHAAGGEEPRSVVVPVAAVRLIELSAPDPQRPVGFAV